MTTGRTDRASVWLLYESNTDGQFLTDVIADELKAKMECKRLQETDDAASYHVERWTVR